MSSVSSKKSKVPSKKPAAVPSGSQKLTDSRRLAWHLSDGDGQTITILANIFNPHTKKTRAEHFRGHLCLHACDSDLK